MPTVSYGITNTADDVSVLGPGDLRDNLPATGSFFGSPYIAGLRFLGVAVPQGATITSSKLRCRAGSTIFAGSSYGIIRVVDSINAPPWSTTDPSVAVKAGTGIAVQNVADIEYDVTALVQLIVNEAAWSSGNAIAFATEVASADGLMSWVDYATSTTDCAQLSITYEVGGPDVTAPTITSSATPSVVEGSALSHALTANETVTWTKVGGANAAAFTLTGSTLSLSAQTYPSGPCVVVVRATDAAGNWTEQTITVTVTQAPLVSFIGSATGTTSATIPPHQPGDLIVAFAFRDGSATLPTLPTGQDWASVIAPTGANTCSMRLAAKIADTSSEATGTFTSATSLIVHVYRPRPGVTLSVGAAASVSGTSTTVSFPALALQDPSGNSFVAGFVGHRSVNTTLGSPPTGMVNRSAVVDATDEAAGHDTDGGVTSWPLTTKVVGGTSSGWFGATVEIKVNLPVTARPTFQAFIIG